MNVFPGGDGDGGDGVGPGPGGAGVGVFGAGVGVLGLGVGVLGVGAGGGVGPAGPTAAASSFAKVFSPKVPSPEAGS